jgi:uncharacterized protein YkwD
MTVDQLADRLSTYQVSTDRVNLHVVMGAVDKAQFSDVLTAAHSHHLRVTLLGWKTTHRGATYSKKDYSWWLDEINELRTKGHCPSLSIDTVLAAQSEDQLIAAGIPKYLYHTEDGAFSAYIDAVEKKLGKSSYEVDTDSCDLPADTKLHEFRQLFARF